MSGHESTPPDSGGSPVRQAHGGALRPFFPGDPRAEHGRARAAAAKREQSALREARLSDVRALLSDLVNAHPHDELGPLARAVACEVMSRVMLREIEIRNATEAADLLRLLAEIADREW